MTQVIGHRGSMGYEPENTLRSFRRAIETGVDIIELDARLTLDGQVVVMHDEMLDRTTDGNGLVAEKKYSEIAELRTGIDVRKNERIPLLSEVFELVKGTKVIVQVEIKDINATVPVVELIKKSGLFKKAEITSFWHPEILRVKELVPEISTGALIDHRPVSAKPIFKETKADRICVHFSFVDSAIVDEVHKLKKKITTWGDISNKEEIDRMIKIGVDAITSNFPDTVIARINKMGR
jgi:glycerophosphoryl diester phosphodiesterase